MRFARRHRVLIVLLGLGILLSVLVGYRIKKQQAAAVPRRQLEIVVGRGRAEPRGDESTGALNERKEEESCPGSPDVIF